MVKGSDVVTAAVRIQPLDWELSDAVGVAKKNKKQKTRLFLIFKTEQKEKEL